MKKTLYIFMTMILCMGIFGTVPVFAADEAEDEETEETVDPSKENEQEGTEPTEGTTTPTEQKTDDQPSNDDNIGNWDTPSEEPTGEPTEPGREIIVKTDEDKNEDYGTYTTDNPNTGLNEYIIYIVPGLLIGGSALILKRRSLLA